LHEKSYQTSSLCNLWVLCASVVEQIVRKNNHRGTEDPEVAQRNQTFRAKPTCSSIHSRGKMLFLNLAREGGL
jgi:hypothetical protein